jgi:predicted nuclease of predicted toxin-antitoxin system
MKFLVDVNMPKYFSFFNYPEFYFVSDIDLKLTDSKIWDYAIENNLVIVTKDTDFFNKSILSKEKPKIIYFKIGNATLKQMHEYFEKNWNIILRSIESHFLVVCTPTNIIIKH